MDTPSNHISSVCGAIILSRIPLIERAQFVQGTYVGVGHSLVMVRALQLFRTLALG
jgi:hypothetical protein